MGICFVGKKKGVGKRGFQDFISEYIDEQPGEFIDIDTNTPVGTHNGLHQWTIGQRTRLKRGSDPYFIIAKDPSTNVIQVASEIDHPALYSDSFFTKNPHWISGDPEALSSRASDKTMSCEFRFQNVAPLTKERFVIGIFSTGKYFPQNSVHVLLKIFLRLIFT